MTLLWTDACFFLMLCVVFFGFGWRLRKKHTRQAVKGLLKKSSAVCSGIILLTFLGIAVLDSIHFNSGELEIRAEGGSLSSVLDYILAPLGQTSEKTYSAPFALTLYSTETVFEQGVVKQIFPRLSFLPDSIQTPQDILILTVKVLGLLLTVMLPLLLLCLWLCERRFQESVFYDSLKWGSVTVCVCIFMILSCYILSRSFHVLGTGKIGQDILYYTVKSIRTALIIGILTTLFMLPLAILCGLAAGYFGGWVDDVIQYIYTTLSSIPGVLLITASVLSMQTYIAAHPEQFPTLDKNADARLLALCLILGVTSWTSLCRLLRAESLKLREIDFVLAARALGSSVLTIFYRHLLPNVMPMILMTMVLDFSFLVLAEAVLSYVGVGVSPMTISWGNMINGARLELAREPLVWWPVLAAFMLMFMLVLACNVFADALRDVIDPKNTGKRAPHRRKLLKHL